MPPSADVLIKDAPSDTGAEPFTGQPFWESPDIVVRQTDDKVFVDQPAVQGQKNFVYVRVHNRGTETANNVTVSLRAVAFPGSEFLYPQDWTTVDATHVKPTGVTPHFNHLAPGATEIAKFRIEKDDVDVLYGWEQIHRHPCLLAEVTCDGDPTAGGFAVHVWDRNNLAQRNITVIPKLQPFIKRIPRASLYAFVAGNRSNLEPYMEVMIDRSAVPRSVELLLDPASRESVFPTLSDEDLGRGRPRDGEGAREHTAGAVVLRLGRNRDPGAGLVVRVERRRVRRGGPARRGRGREARRAAAARAARGQGGHRRPEGAG